MLIILVITWVFFFLDELKIHFHVPWGKKACEIHINLSLHRIFLVSLKKERKDRLKSVRYVKIIIIKNLTLFLLQSIQLTYWVCPLQQSKMKILTHTYPLNYQNALDNFVETPSTKFSKDILILMVRLHLANVSSPA